MKPTPSHADELRAAGANPLFDRMRAQHAYVLEELAQLERALAAPRSPGTRSVVGTRTLRAAIERLSREFAAHVSDEDEILIPLLASGLPEGPAFVRGLPAEHAELRAMLATFAITLDRPEGEARDEQIAVQGRDLVLLLRSQIRKEETLVFTIAERLIARPKPIRGEPS